MVACGGDGRLFFNLVEVCSRGEGTSRSHYSGKGRCSCSSGASRLHSRSVIHPLLPHQHCAHNCICAPVARISRRTCNFSDTPSHAGTNSSRMPGIDVRGVLHLGDQGARLHLVLLCGFDLN